MPEPETQRNPVSSPPEMLPRIVAVEADPQTHMVLATFANGERRRYDVRPLLTRDVFRRLRKANVFAAVRVDEMGGIAWDAGPDLSRDTIYLNGNPA